MNLIAERRPQTVSRLVLSEEICNEIRTDKRVFTAAICFRWAFDERNFID